MPVAASGTKGTGQTLLSFILFVMFLVPLLQFMYMKSWQTLMSRKKRDGLFTRQMTPIGRFSFMSQTESNPSIITFFIALANDNGTKDVDMEVFEELWKTRIMNKHERFQCRVPKTRNHCFEINERPFEEYCKVVAHPNDHKEFKARVSDFHTSPLDIHKKLWECQVSTGDLGSSGAIIKDN
ncbi:hypothetical protein ACHAWO_007648 [Cyclotella atomus]|uniref:Uncharacterized protein n=1 Tax=Cyclotella atomus TaxID=382360 RepID=A0ABD3Q310_9STRA